MAHFVSVETLPSNKMFHCCCHSAQSETSLGEAVKGGDGEEEEGPGWCALWLSGNAV